MARLNTCVSLLIIYILSLTNTFCTSTGKTSDAITKENVLIRTDDLFSVEVNVTPDIGSMKESVFTYYEQLQPEYIPHYKIQQGKDGFYSKSQNGERIKPLMDINNGYIEIMDDQLGEGHEKVQFVLFKKTDGSDVIVISIQKHNGFGLSQSSYVLHIINGQPIDKSKEALGVLSPWAFLPDDYVEEEHIVFDAIPVLIDLPRKGTTARAIASTEKKFFYCSDKANEEQAIACGVYGRLRRTSIDLKWNKQKGLFEWE